MARSAVGEGLAALDWPPMSPKTKFPKTENVKLLALLTPTIWPTFVKKFQFFGPIYGKKPRTAVHPLPDPFAAMKKGTLLLRSEVNKKLQAKHIFSFN